MFYNLLIFINSFFQGFRIHATVRKLHIDKLAPILKENHLFTIKIFIVTDNTMKYKTTTEKYKLIFVARTRLTEIFDDTFPWMVYNFKPFQDFSNPDFVDVSVMIGMDFFYFFKTKFNRSY